MRLSCDTRWQPASKETDPRIRVWRRRVGDAVVDEVKDELGMDPRLDVASQRGARFCRAATAVRVNPNGSVALVRRNRTALDARHDA